MTFARMAQRNRQRSGIGVLDYNDLMRQANLSNCNPMDSACVSNNVARQAAVEDYWVGHMANGVPDGTVLTFTPQTSQQVLEFYNPNPYQVSNIVDTRGVMQVTPPTPVYTTPINQVTNTNPFNPPASTSYSPKVVFINHSGGSNVLVGDSWQISISGARPGVGVDASANGSTTRMGVTDQYGGFVLNGVFGVGDVGDWEEVWTAGTVAGTVRFTVRLPVSQTQTPTISNPLTKPVNTTLSDLFGHITATPVLGGSLFGYDSTTVLEIAGAVVVGVVLLKSMGGR